jgi:hypothetical protein
MNKRTCITLAIIAVGLAVCAGFFLFPRQLTPEECGALYQRYKDAEGIDASFIKDFPVNDTLTTDALLLEAATDSAWCELLLDFGASKDLISLYKTNKELFVGEDVCSITEFSVDKNNTKKHIPLTDSDSWLVIGSHTKKTLCILLTENNNQKSTISLINIKDLKNENQF